MPAPLLSGVRRAYLGRLHCRTWCGLSSSARRRVGAPPTLLLSSDSSPISITGGKDPVLVDRWSALPDRCPIRPLHARQLRLPARCRRLGGRVTNRMSRDILQSGRRRPDLVSGGSSQFGTSDLSQPRQSVPSAAPPPWIWGSRDIPGTSITRRGGS